MAGVGRGVLRPGQGSKQSILLITLCVIIVILGANYWSLSSKYHRIISEFERLHKNYKLRSFIDVNEYGLRTYFLIQSINIRSLIASLQAAAAYEELINIKKNEKFVKLLDKSCSDITKASAKSLSDKNKELQDVHQKLLYMETCRSNLDNCWKNHTESTNRIQASLDDCITEHELIKNDAEKDRAEVCQTMFGEERNKLKTECDKEKHEAIEKTKEACQNAVQDKQNQLTDQLSKQRTKLTIPTAQLRQQRGQQQRENEAQQEQNEVQQRGQQQRENEAQQEQNEVQQRGQQQRENEAQQEQNEVQQRGQQQRENEAQQEQNEVQQRGQQQRENEAQQEQNEVQQRGQQQRENEAQQEQNEVQQRGQQQQENEAQQEQNEVQQRGQQQRENEAQQEQNEVQQRGQQQRENEAQQEQNEVQQRGQQQRENEAQQEQNKVQQRGQQQRENEAQQEQNEVQQRGQQQPNEIQQQREKEEKQGQQRLLQKQQQETRIQDKRRRRQQPNAMQLQQGKQSQNAQQQGANNVDNISLHMKKEPQTGVKVLAQRRPVQQAPVQVQTAVGSQSGSDIEDKAVGNIPPNSNLQAPNEVELFKRNADRLDNASEVRGLGASVSSSRASTDTHIRVVKDGDDTLLNESHLSVGDERAAADAPTAVENKLEIVGLPEDNPGVEGAPVNNNKNNDEEIGREDLRANDGVNKMESS